MDSSQVFSICGRAWGGASSSKKLGVVGSSIHILYEKGREKMRHPDTWHLDLRKEHRLRLFLLGHKPSATLVWSEDACMHKDLAGFAEMETVEADVAELSICGLCVAP